MFENHFIAVAAVGDDPFPEYVDGWEEYFLPYGWQHTAPSGYGADGPLKDMPSIRGEEIASGKCMPEFDFHAVNHVKYKLKVQPSQRLWLGGPADDPIRGGNKMHKCLI